MNKKKLLMAAFEKEGDVLDATRATRAQGHAIHDVYTPYAVHGLDEAMGIKNSRLRFVCMAFGVLGLTIAVTGQFWIGAMDWPLNVGGKPLNSLPAYLPIMFELLVLLSGVGVVVTLLARSQLYPGKKEWLAHERVTDDRFVLAVESEGTAHYQQLTALWKKWGVSETYAVDPAPKKTIKDVLPLAGMALVGLAVVGGLVAFGMPFLRDSEQRSWQYFPDMARSAATRSQDASGHAPDHQIQRAPVQGTIARGALPLPYNSSVRDYVRAGRELTSPFTKDHPADMERAETLFRSYCRPCHGDNLEGDGPVVQHGFPPPPSLLFGKALNMNDGHIFHIATHGFRNMPSYASQLRPEERWLVIAYIRQLQRSQP